MKEYFGKAKGFILVVDSGDKYEKIYLELDETNNVNFPILIYSNNFIFYFSINYIKA